MLGSKLVRPVIWPPGLARLATKPSPIGSETCAKTIGMDLVARHRAIDAGVLEVKITSGAILTRYSGPPSELIVSPPIRRLRSGCCARAASGQATAPPSKVTKSRRL